MSNATPSFDPRDDNKVPLDQAREIKTNGHRHGSGTQVKDCYWAGYSHGGMFYLMLNGSPNDCWAVREDEMELHIEDME